MVGKSLDYSCLFCYWAWLMSWIGSVMKESVSVLSSVLLMSVVSVVSLSFLRKVL